MSSVPCPSCGADITLRSSAMPYAVCDYCQTVIARDGEDLRAQGKAAVLPFDVSPLQIGTTGIFDAVPFTVIGRVRWGWSDGSWNEWLLECGDGTPRWLGEAMGLLMVTGARPDLADQPWAQAFARGAPPSSDAMLTLDKEVYAPADLKVAECIGAEGALPFPAEHHWTMTSLDMTSPSGKLVSLQRDARGMEIWAGRYVSLADLKPANLRRLTGWTRPKALA